MTTTDLPRSEIYTAPTPGGIGAGAAIFRRLERGQRKPKWMGVAIAAVLAVSAIGIGIALKAMSPSSAPPPAMPAQSTSAAPPATAAPVANPTPAAAPAPSAAPTQLRVTHAPVKAAGAPTRRARVNRAASRSERASAPIAASPQAVSPPTTASSTPVTAPSATAAQPVNPPASSTALPTTTTPPVVAAPSDSTPPASPPAPQ